MATAMGKNICTKEQRPGQNDERNSGVSMNGEWRIYSSHHIKVSTLCKMDAFHCVLNDTTFNIQPLPYHCKEYKY